jgi:hypothetical protein
MNSKNVLSESVYLIPDDLHGFLYHSDSTSGLEDKSMIKNREGVYLILIRVLNSNSKVLIYNYIYYPDVFYNPLKYFLINKKDYKNSLLYSEWGDYLGVFVLSDLNKMPGDSLKLNKINDYLSNFLDNEGVGSTILISNYNELFKLINMLNYTSDYDDVATLIDLAYNKKHDEFGYTILSSVGDNLFNRSISFNISESDQIPKINITNSCLYIVDDLNFFIEKVKSKGYVINAGPQKWRGQVNSMNNFLTCIDVDFRNSLYRHNQHHVTIRSIDSKLSLAKSKFSYRNIHQNITGVRWYSTKRAERSSSKKVAISSSNKVKVSVNLKSISENSPIFNYLSQWLAQSPINNETQESLEKYLHNFTYINIDKSSVSIGLIDYSSFSKKLTELLIKSRVRLNKIITHFKNLSYDNIGKKKLNQKETSLYYLSILLKEVNNNEIIALMYGRLMRIITNYNRLNTNDNALDIFQGVCTNIIQDYWFNLYSKHILKLCFELYGLDIHSTLNKQDRKELDLKIFETRKIYSLSQWKIDNTDLVDVFNNVTLKSNIGSIIIEWMVECNLIKTELITLGRKEKKNILVPTDEVIDCLSTHSSKLVHLPFRLPMLVKPKPYFREVINGVTVERLGGYLLNDIKTSDTLILDNWELKKSTLIKDDNVVYDMVNNINSVGYKINKDVLGYINKYGIEYDLVLYKDSPYSDRAISSLKKWEKIELESDRAKKELQDNILGLAYVYSQLHEFFLPVRIDFRGRMYCISEFLNYQSNELAKSLLIFSRGEKIKKTDAKAIDYLKAYGANCFGNKLDKKSWFDRCKWVDDNVNGIINFEDGKLVSKASNKLLFIAFCFEYNRWLESLKNIETIYFDTYLPIQLDATCNGFQHLSLLSLDVSLAKELNLTTSSWKDIPKDFYNFVSTNLIDYFRNILISNNIEESEMEDYLRLSNLTIARAIVKKAIMTIPYNVSTIQMIKYVRVNFELCDEYKNREDNKDFKNYWYYCIDDPNIKLKHSDFTKIGLGLKYVLSDKFFKLKLLMDYLKKVAKICTRLGLPIPWGSPSGVLVNQSYLGTDVIRLRPFTYSKSKFTLRVPNKNKTNSSKQVRAFMPNLIHSLDAAALALLADFYFHSNKNSKTKSMYAVHDCFAVTANNVENLMELLKLVYIKIYSEGVYLRGLDKEIKHQIKVNYGADVFNYDKLTINIPDIEVLKFPDIEEVLGTKLPCINYDVNELKTSSYIVS